MKAKAHVVHSVPGRTRFRVRNRRHDRAFFQGIEQRLARVPQVESVAADPRTGSVLVHHRGSALDLLMAAAETGLTELVDLEEPEPLALQLRAEIQLFDDLVRRSSSGQLDLSTVAMLGLFTLAAFQIVRGNHPLIGISLAWYAAELLRRWEAPAETRPG
jgi:Heavy metal associated domain 2